MKKLNNYLRPSVKVRAMEAVMLDLSNQVGGTQLAPQPDNSPAQTPEMVQGEEQVEEVLPVKKNLWEEE